MGNCITYNSEGSDIVKVAEELTRKLHGIVRPPVDSSAMVSSSTDARQSPQEYVKYYVCRILALLIQLISLGQGTGKDRV